jgi:hypothetical protein
MMRPTALIDPPPVEPFYITPMVVFPVDLEFALTTTEDYADDVRIDRAVDGTGRARSFYTGPKRIINAALRGLSPAQWSEFDQFYRTNRATPFTIPWGQCGSQANLPVMFQSPPRHDFSSWAFSHVTFTLVEFP